MEEQTIIIGNGIRRACEDEQWDLLVMMHDSPLKVRLQKTETTDSTSRLRSIHFHTRPRNGRKPM